MISRKMLILVIAMVGLLCFPPLTSPFELLPEKGVLFETFDECDINCTLIDPSMSYGYSIENGRVRIKMGSYVHDRDYYYPDNNWVFYRNNSNPLFVFNMWIRPDVLISLERRLSAIDPDYISLESVDNITFISESDWKFFVPLQHFRFNISYHIEGITGLVFKWYGSTNGEKIRIYVWKKSAFLGIGRWVLQDEIDTNSSTLTIIESLTENCISDGYVDVILLPIQAESNRTFIETDYVCLETIKPITDKASVITIPFEIENDSRWEYIEWWGNTENGTDITLQILDGDGNVIDDDILEGNFEGFKKERVVLADLNIRKIRLKFRLETAYPPKTPYLDDFLLLWQPNSTRWEDDLSTDYRLERKSDTLIVSKPIYLPAGCWWKDFFADVDFQSGGNVTFSILDLDGNILIGNITGENKTVYNISIISERVIKLKADIEGYNGSFPEIERWGVTYFPESDRPVLRYPDVIFVSSDDISRGKMDATIKAMDNFSGICKTSGRYRLFYIENETGNILNSTWLKASIDAENGTTTWVNVTAKNIPLFYDDSIKDILGLEEKKKIRLSRIKFRVEDMAGNRNETENIDIQIDTTPPKSWIVTTVDDIGFKHHEPVLIVANAIDNISNIKSVTLYYRKSIDNKTFSDPTKYKTLFSYPWEWTFAPDESGYYKFFTIAEDGAGNKEGTKEGELTLLIDMFAPEKPEFPSGIHWLNNSKIDFVMFSDDFCIDKIEYKINDEQFGWKTIASNINLTTYEDAWYIDDVDWNMMQDGKTYQIYFRITDKVGNRYTTPDPSHAMIVGKDTTPPQPYISPIETWQWNLPVKISCYISPEGSDIVSVKLFYRYSEDNESWSEWKLYNTTVFSGWFNWTFEPEEGDGYYQLRVEAMDSAGNHATSEYVSFGLTGFPKVETILMILLYTLLIIVSAVLIRRWS